MNNFSLLQESINSNTEFIEIEESIHPLYKRFFSSYNIKFGDRSLLDISILLRQILLYETINLRKENFASLDIPINSKWPSELEWKKVGIQYTKVNNNWNISANLWTPSWLNKTDIQAVDYWANSDLNKRDEINFKSNASDIFLSKCGSKYVKYTSIDQQKAVRSTLSLEKGKTLAISLPTGEGKSLVFKSINSIGFFDTKNKGLTLVIVPTVTLALDQEKDLQVEKENNNPYAYIGGREFENKILKEKIKDSEQDICFISPEAANGSLRQVLLTAAKNGNIRAIVIDEAHIVEEWGTGFRHDYQLFAGLWRQLLENSPISNQFRTILLSATFTQESINLVQTLFSFNEYSFEVYSASKLRPEIDYWISEITNDEDLRERRIIESIYNLPRPAILYTTEVDDAKRYYQLLQDSGLKNIRIIHGESSTTDRNNVIEKWKSGQLDIVVATSAFGLGIDYQHTRSIIHACVPETLNRFYQEVGRGGRDGRSSISLLLPTKKDLATASRMNQKKFLENENAYNRWQTMFNNKKPIENKRDEYIIDLGAAPSRNIDYDSTGHNREWNIHVILLMVRAKLLQLSGIPVIEDNDLNYEDYNRYVIVCILDENHYKKDVWTQNIEPVRINNKRANKESFNLLLEFIKQDKCPADILSQLYRFSYLSKTYEVSLLCSNCNICRSSEKKYNHPPLRRSFPVQKKSLSIFNLFVNESILVEYQEEDFSDRLYKRSFYKVLDNFILNGIQNFIYIGNAHKSFLSEKIQSKISGSPIYVERIKNLNQIRMAEKLLPNRTYVILIGNDILFDHNIIDILNKKDCIVFMSKNSIDPNTPGRFLSDVYSNEKFTINELITKVGI